MSRRTIWLALLAGVFCTGFVVIRNAIGLEFAPESMHAAIADLGVWAPLAYVGIVVFRVPLGLPSQVVLIGGGLVFGATSGALYGALGLVLSATFLFLAARFTGRDAVERRLPERLRPMFEVAGSRAGGLFVAFGTGYPFGPITMYHLAAGVTGMAVSIFLVAVAAGALMRSALFTYFGSRLISGDPTAILQASLPLAAVVAIPLCFARSRAWIVRTVGLGRVARAPVAEVRVDVEPPAR